MNERRNTEFDEVSELMTRVKDSFLLMQDNAKALQREIAIQTRCIPFKVKRDDSLRYIDAGTGMEVPPHEYELRYKCFLNEYKKGNKLARNKLVISPVSITSPSLPDINCEEEEVYVSNKRYSRGQSKKRRIRDCYCM
jgi:hypothetical protein